MPPDGLARRTLKLMAGAYYSLLRSLRRSNCRDLGFPPIVPLLAALRDPPQPPPKLARLLVPRHLCPLRRSHQQSIAPLALRYQHPHPRREDRVCTLPHLRRRGWRNALQCDQRSPAERRKMWRVKRALCQRTQMLKHWMSRATGIRMTRVSGLLGLIRAPHGQ